MSHISQISAPLERLVSSLLTDPDGLLFTGSVLNGRVNFTLSASIRDFGGLVGQNGSHLRALQLIAEQMGKVQGSQWVVRLEEPEGERQPAYPKTPPPAEHDTADDALILADLLEGLGVNAFVEVSGDIPSGYVFKVSPFAHQDKDALETPHPSLYSPNQRETKPLSLVAAIGTLFRAVGRKSGVTYQISIA